MDDRPVSSLPTDMPSLAVAICTKDRIASLCKTIESVWEQSHLPQELIVIDDGTMPDEVWEDIAFGCQDRGIVWKYEKKDLPGLTRSRNWAAEIADSDVILFLDDDVTCDANALAEMVRLFVDPSVGGVTANLLEPKLDTPGGRRYAQWCNWARWWALHPRVKPTTSKPKVISDSSVAAKAKWMSGAAMAYRRELVLTHRFDEALAEYALGEDREFGYRLAPHTWLLEARLAKITHRRETTGRANPRRLGYMTSFNYLYILNKTCNLRGWRRAEPYYSLIVLAARLLLGMVRDQRAERFAELRGMMSGAVAWLNSDVRAQLKSARTSDVPHPQRGRGTQTALPGSSVSDFINTPGAPALLGLGDTLPHDSNRFDTPTSNIDPSGAPAPLGLGDHLTPGLTRALFVTNRLEPGGAERMLIDLARHLPAHCVTPSIACLQDAGPLATQAREMGITVHEHLLKFKYDFAAAWRLARLIREQQIDVCVVAHSGGDRMFWTTLAARLGRRPVVVWSHWYPTDEQRHLERPNRVLMHWVDQIIALGSAHRQAWINVENAPAAKVSVVHNGIDLTRFEDLPPRESVRAELGLEENDFAVALVANLRPEKRHDVFISAAKLLASEDDRYRFLIVGGGPSESDLRRAVEAAGLAERTLTMLGPRSDIPQLLSGLDACCLCSDIECFSVVMLEAAAAGCPFIGPAVGSMTEFLTHQQTGLAIKPANPTSLADAVRTLAADVALRQKIVANAKTRVREGFALDAVASRFALLLHAEADRTRTSASRRIATDIGRHWQHGLDSIRTADSRTVR